ncbi:M23 family metallopeptidase [Bacteroidales bacterium OttesenSCG-928-B11]|nr:M23 family metallopeptidase [Bacteroidales bacterium OttesenSCG-928-B11]MDL2325733.1 M23 family metallopeptidase [Bacteroidales bacterium OttesenSCG-928-A14]
MADKEFYHFNPETLAFEKKKLTFKEIFKRAVWLVASALSFSILVLWLSFYLFDSPKEKMLQRENNELKQALKNANQRLDMMDVVLTDIEERDDEVYRTIFEAEPLSRKAKFSTLYTQSKYSDLNPKEATLLLNEIKEKSDQLTVRLAAQSRSLDTVMDLAQKKTEMLSAIPAIRPLKNMYNITSGFGRRYHPILKTLRPHTGIDIAAPKGTPVYATADGTVARENGGSGYGITVIINHGYSYQTVYAHLSKKVVRSGQKVKRGQIIGYVGSTGLSMGTHLHYEVLKGGKYVNPVHYFYSDITPEEYESILKSSQEVNQSLS